MKKNTVKLKEGVVLRPFGPSSAIDEKNITDENATFMLESGRASEDDFETLPEGYAAKSEDKEETAAEKKERLAAEKKAKAEQVAAEKKAKTLKNVPVNTDGVVRPDPVTNPTNQE